LLKTMILLPDGRTISSGAEADIAILSAALTQCVNDSYELTLGSVCADMLELQILDPEHALHLNQGDEIQAYKIDEDGNSHPLGRFLLQTPKRSGPNVLHLTAYDRVSMLDRDLTGWLRSLEGWPYSLLTFAGMVCDACGLQLVNETLPNESYLVQAFTGQGITGRKLMQWVGQIAGRFCRATSEGNLEFAWYTPSGVQITPDGDRCYFGGGLSYENYRIAPIEKVQLRLTQDDVGTVWPDEPGEKNTYIITGNYLLTSTDTDALLPVAHSLYEMLKDITYTPCKVQIPAGMDIQAGHTVDITDRNGVTITAYVMTKAQTGQLDILECTGSYTRNSSDAMNYEDYRELNSKLLELRKQADGAYLRASEHREDMQALSKAVADVQLKADHLQLHLTQLDSSTGQTLQSVSDTVQSMQKELSAKVTPEGLQMQLQAAMESGAEKVVTKTGFTLDEAGLSIEKSGSEMKTQITENGMVVYQNSQEVLTANNKGVDAKNLHATTYLIVGTSSRFEDYGYDRTGCFWIGG